ncbi:TRAP transporter substrate-binding protein DctP [uncultured Reyranella sp.]|uniref:TRAP transporter substrate-binding protein DctP n=1 Tax=uncultured Reyranella sp. TaxID=735512 RepID=UPI0025F13C3E|nr:TRAP transporter substrate-binding protein DctP [uncultured Reyranella sp.]
MRVFLLSVMVALLLGPVAARAETIGLSTVHRPDYPSALAMAEMSRLVAERTAGRIKLALQPKSGDTESFTLQQVRTGRLAMAAVGVASFHDLVPATTALSLPYLFESDDHVHRTLDGPIGEQILASLDDIGLVGLCFYDPGYRSIMARRPIRTVADMKNLKIGVPLSEMARATAQAMGGQAVSLPGGLVHEAIRAGLVDAAEENPSAYLSAFLASRQKAATGVYSLTQHTRPPEVLVISKMAWQLLSPDDQKLLRAAAEESVKLQRQLRVEREEMARATAASLGVEIVREVDRKAFADAIGPVYARYAADPVVRVLVERIKAIAAVP